eukprot:gene7349-11671_t
MNSMGFKQIIDYLNKSKEPSYRYFANIVQVLLTVQRMCTENPNWKRNLHSSLMSLVNINFNWIKHHFARNVHLRNRILGRMGRANSAIKEIVRS